MNQYDKSGPPARQIPAQEIESESRIKQLSDTVARQQHLIEDLQKEIRRLKDKMDQHADYLNRQNRG